MSDFDQTYERGFKLGYRPCRSCEREHPASNLTGMAQWCQQCSASSPEELALALEEQPERLRAVAATWRDSGLREQAEELDRIAEREEQIRYAQYKAIQP